MQIVIELSEERFYSLKGGHVQHGSIAERQIINAVKEGTVLPEHVVRCKDCRFYHPTYCEMWSKFGTIMTAENGFCYWGKEKECQH